MPRISTVRERSVSDDGVISIRIAKQVVDGGEILAEQPHRIIIAPGQDVDGVITDVDENLTQMGYGPVVNWTGVRALAAAEHTPEVVQAYQAKLAAQVKE